MSIKLSGMISGLDTDSMITELVSAYSEKKDNIYRNQKTLEYKQDAWKSMNTKIYNLFSGKLSSLRFSANYAKKASQVSSTKASVTAGSTAVNGTQSLKITQLAKSGYLTGARLDGSYTADSKMSEFGVTSDTRINVSVNGKDSFIDVTSDMTITQFTTQLKEKGLNASFDTINQRFFISSKESGASADFSLSGNNDLGNTLLKNMGIYNVSSKDISSYKEYINNASTDPDYITNLAKDEYLNSILSSMKKDIQSNTNSNNTKINENNSNITLHKEDISFANMSDADKDELMTKLSENITNQQKSIDEKKDELSKETDDEKKAALEKEISDMEEALKTMTDKRDRFNDIKTAVGSSESDAFKDKVKVIEDDRNAKITVLESENEALKTANEDNDKKINEITENMSKSVTEKETYLGTDKFDYSSSEFSLIVDKYNEKLESAKNVVADYERYDELSKLGDSASDAEKSELAALKTKLGLDSSSTSATRIEGSDAVIYLNGAEFTSSSNNFSINGLTITANAVTAEDEEITITTSNDVDGIYNLVKDFFKEYNEVMKGMEEAYNAESAGDYKPLTEEEEDEMSDKQIEKWEKKLTTAALRKDDTLSSIISTMKNAMTRSYEVDGTSYNLASFGIKTLAYFNAAENEKGLYHIDGDADDSVVSGKEDKLRAAIASDPDTFISFFSQLTSDLYKDLNGKMASSSLSSAYTVYNDKQMTKQYNQYKKDIKSWEEKVEKMREKYEKQFAAMEKAMSTLNSQQSNLASMLGQ